MDDEARASAENDLIESAMTLMEEFDLSKQDVIEVLESSLE